MIIKTNKSGSLTPLPLAPGATNTPFTLNYTLLVPYSFTTINYIHGSDTLQDLTTPKGSLMLPVRLSTRPLAARKSVESKNKKSTKR